MREIFTLLLTQLFFLILIYLDKRKLLFFLIGLTIGYISITTGIWPIYILILVLYFIIQKNKFSSIYSLFFIWFCDYKWSLDYYNKEIFWKILLFKFRLLPICIWME